MNNLERTKELKEKISKINLDYKNGLINRNKRILLTMQLEKNFGNAVKCEEVKE